MTRRHNFTMRLIRGIDQIAINPDTKAQMAVEDEMTAKTRSAPKC